MMEHLKNIAAIILILLVVSCTNQRLEKSRDRNYTSAELIGKWNHVSTDKSINDTNAEIEFIQLVNDSIAEVRLTDSTGKRTVIGKWENGFKKGIEILDLTFESDIKITYNLGDNQYYVLLLRVGEENEKTIMTAHNHKFEKEE